MIKFENDYFEAFQTAIRMWFYGIRPVYKVLKTEIKFL